MATRFGGQAVSQGSTLGASGGSTTRALEVATFAGNAMDTNFQTVFNITAAGGKGLYGIQWAIAYAALAATAAESKVTITDSDAGTHTYTLLATHNGADVHRGDHVSAQGGTGASSAQAMLATFPPDAKKITGFKLEARSPSGSFTPTITRAVVTYEETS